MWQTKLRQSSSMTTSAFNDVGEVDEVDDFENVADVDWEMWIDDDNGHGDDGVIK